MKWTQKRTGRTCSRGRQHTWRAVTIRLQVSQRSWAPPSLQTRLRWHLKGPAESKWAAVQRISQAKSLMVFHHLQASPYRSILHCRTSHLCLLLQNSRHFRITASNSTWAPTQPNKCGAISHPYQIPQRCRLWKALRAFQSDPSVTWPKAFRKHSRKEQRMLKPISSRLQMCLRMMGITRNPTSFTTRPKPSASMSMKDTGTGLFPVRILTQTSRLSSNSLMLCISVLSRAPLTEPRAL